MSWFPGVFAIGAGAGVLVVWMWAGLTGTAGRMLEGRTDGAGHVAAELATAGLLLAGGIATLADEDAAASLLLYGLGAGALFYALIEAPAHYLRRGPKPVAVALLATWPFAIAAVVARFS